MALLRLPGGTMTPGICYPLDQDDMVLGRSPDCAVHLTSLTVSRRHARITRRGMAYVLADLGSAGGTYLQGHRLCGLAPLHNGDQIHLGQYVFTFEEYPPTMTPEMWSSCDNVQTMLAWLRDSGRGTMRSLHWFNQVLRGHLQVQSVRDLVETEDAENAARAIILQRTVRRDWGNPQRSLHGVEPRTRSDEELWVAYDETQQTLCDALRDVVGNPFVPVPSIDPTVLTWQNGLVRRLAESAQESGQASGTLDADQLAVLADALADAGGPEVMIAHLHTARPHLPGCWVVDALLRAGG